MDGPDTQIHVAFVLHCKQISSFHLEQLSPPQEFESMLSSFFPIDDQTPSFAGPIQKDMDNSLGSCAL